MSGYDWNAIGTAIAAVVITGGGIATGAWAWWQKHLKTAAVTRADIADANADRTVADAQQAVYRLLTSRLEALEAEVAKMREELATERTHNRDLLLHIWRLESLMRAAGLDPPPFQATSTKG